MPLSIRPVTLDDLGAVADLLLHDAKQRNALNAAVWPLPDDARARIEAAVRASLAGASGREVWRLAEIAGRIVGVAHAMIVPVPPIYGGLAGPPGLFLDDCFAAPDAPTDTAAALLVGAEAALREAGAASLIASCPAAGPWRPLYQAHGYEPVTLYLAKHGFRDRSLAPGLRPAGADDGAGIVELSAAHRRTLAELNPRFWSIHPDADARFDRWMRFSLTLADRDMVVAGAPSAVRGYVIAQPIAPLLIPAAHDIAAVGVIDDFYDADFAGVPTLANGGTGAGELLSAAESAFARRGVAAALAVCPAAWTSKVALLEAHGWRTAKLWMLKR
jgi:hypothetical protein